MIYELIAQQFLVKEISLYVKTKAEVLPKTAAVRIVTLRKEPTQRPVDHHHDNSGRIGLVCVASSLYRRC